MASVCHVRKWPLQVITESAYMRRMKDHPLRETSMGRLPKPAARSARGLPIFPAPVAADYSDEVTEEDIKVLDDLVRKDADEKEEWEVVDGPGW